MQIQHNSKAVNLHTYVHKIRKLREDFEKLKNPTMTEKDVDEILEKYEYFMEWTYTMIPWTRMINYIIYLDDNVSYEWRHAKGLMIASTAQVETDYFGYYDRNLESYYPKAREWQFRDEYPMEENLYEPDFSNNWDSINENDNSINLGTGKTPQEFKQEVVMLKEKYKISKPKMWAEGSNSTGANH
jgi:hypothetical protein